MFAVAVTDRDWFDYQSSHDFIDGINFWTPSPNCPRQISTGDFFVFKLAGLGDLIGGYGTFVEYKYQSLDDAWKEFGRKNGADTKEEFVNKIKSFGPKNDTACGCIVLKDVVYLDEPVKRVQAGFTPEKKPAQLFAYESISFPLGKEPDSPANFSLVDGVPDEAEMQKRKPRKGQSAFHTAVSKAYHSKCCITGETIPELLQAAHIQDYINRDSHHIQNGLLLRIDIHKLFDSGLLYIDQNYHVHVSPLVESEEYKILDDHPISLPNNPSEYPSKAALLFKEKSFRK